MTKLHTLMLITLFCLILSINTAKASTAGAYVYSINKGSPVVELDKYRVSTITRGAAANQPFKAIVQSVPKSLFLTAFRLTVRSTGYGLLFLSAYDYFIDDDPTSVNYGFLVRNNIQPSSEVTGQCLLTASNSSKAVFIASNLSFSACNTALDAALLTIGSLASYYDGQSLNYFVSGSTSFNSMYCGKPDCYAYTKMFRYLSSSETSNASEVISDKDVFASLDAYIASNPNLNHNDMFKDALGNPVKEMFPDPQYYENTQADLDLVELYKQGLLQSTDPTADNYLSPDELARIKALYESLNKTPEQNADDLTAAETKPITQTQHNENQLKAESRAEEKAAGLSNINLDNLDKTQELDEQFNTLDSLITNASGLPSVLPAMPQFNYSSSCQTVELSFGIIFPNSSQCEKLGILKDMLAYFLYIIFAWLITTQLLKEAN